MFEHYYARKRAAQAAPIMSVSALAGKERLSYAEAVGRSISQGVISSQDPRAKLDPARIRQFAEMSNSELMERYSKLAEAGKLNGREKDDRVRYAAIVRAGSEHFDLLRSGATAGLAASTERQAMMLATSTQHDHGANEMLLISAALSDKAQRERALQGFSLEPGRGNIAEAAIQQGRSWMEVRDDLVKHGALATEDPRRKIRAADIEFQRGATYPVKSTLSPAELEAQALRRLSQNPTDEQATTWLVHVGGLQGKDRAEVAKNQTRPKVSLFRRGRELEH